MLKLKSNGETLKICKAERAILLMLMGRPLVTFNDIVEMLCPDPDRQPDYWYDAICVRISYIRRALKKAGSEWFILNVFGHGYRLEKRKPS